MSQNGKVRRFSVSLPPTLVDEFDETWRSMRYENRSKAIHDALRNFITDIQLIKRGKGLVVGVVLILHYLDKPGLVEEVTMVKHRLRKIVASMQQLYIEENKILQIIAVKGKVEEIERLTQELMGIKGVKQVKASIIAP